MSTGPSLRRRDGVPAALRLLRGRLRFLLLGAAVVFSLSMTVSGASLLDVWSDEAPLGQDGNWELVFGDDFAGEELDSSKWFPAFPWGGTSTTTPELVYRRENVTVSDGRLTLRAHRQRDGDASYTSGIVTTANSWGEPYRFTFTYGYVEMRARMPSGAGLWPAFWLLLPQGRWDSEIDVIEVLGSAPSVAEMHFHYVDEEGTRRDDGASHYGPDFSQDFHTFGLEWSPTAIRWFIDGVEARPAITSAEHIPDEAMYLIANLQVGGEWAGTPPADTRFPAEFEIDHIRVWQRR